jgi:hypothetical protein
VKYKFKFTDEIERSGCPLVIKILTDKDESVNKDDVLIIFSDTERKKFHYFKSPFNGLITDIYVEEGQIIKLNNHILSIKKDKTFKNNYSNYNKFSDKFKNDTNEKTPTNTIGCFSFLIRVAFVSFYWLFPTYDTTFANSLSEELNSIQFWIGLLGTLFICWFISKALVGWFVEVEINSKYGLAAIFLLNLVCWIFLPNLLIDWSGEMVIYILDKLFN